MPGQQATIDISARITGYQSSLNQLKQAIDQLDPGSSIRKSLQTAFKNAEGYINKLAKTPVVNVGSDKQLQNLVNTLQQATRLVTNVSDRLGEVTFKDVNADILKDALEGVNQQLTETQQKLDSVAGGPQLSSLTGKVKNLQDAFKLIGQSIDGKNAQQGIELLNQGLEESKRKAQQARAALEAVRKKIAEWKAPEDPTGLFGAKSGGKGTKDIKLLENLKILDVNASTFSPEAINNFKENLRQKLITGLKDLTDEKTLNTITDSIQAGLDNIFTNGLQSKDLKVKVQAFSQGVRDILKQTLGGNFGAAGIYEMMFGSGTTTSDRASGLAKQMLTQMTVEFTQGSEAIKQIIEDVANGGLSAKQPLLKLVQEGQLETVKNKLLQILKAAKEAREEITRTKGGLTAERDTAAANLKAQTQNSAQIEAAKNGILKTEEYQKAIVQISNLRNEIQQLKATISSMQNQKVEGIHRAGENARAAGESYRFTNAEVEQYSNKLDQIKEKEKLVGKIQGVVERWFSIYAAIRMVSNAIRSIISTVQELDKTITNIAIVTDMSQADLWGQMPQYTKMARQFAASISGVYEVSQLYYQQGGLSI